MADLILNMALSVLFATVKSPAAVKRMKAALKKLRDLLDGLPLD